MTTLELIAYYLKTGDTKRLHELRKIISDRYDYYGEPTDREHLDVAEAAIEEMKADD